MLVVPTPLQHQSHVGSYPTLPPLRMVTPIRNRHPTAKGMTSTRPARYLQEPGPMVRSRHDPNSCGCLRTLTQEARSWARKSIAPLTACLYTSANSHYLRFCQHLHFSPYPSSQDHLAIFASQLAHSMSASSISIYITAIKHLHIANGFRPSLLSSQQPPLIIRGIWRSQHR